MASDRESGYPSESRESPLTDDAEDVIVEPIPRAAAKRRNYQQRSHSMSTFDAAPGQPVVPPILFGRRNHGSDSSLHRYASGLGSSRDLDENERSSYSSPMPPAHQQQPPRVLRTLSQSYQQNTTSDRVGQRRNDTRTNYFDRNNVENIAIAVMVPTNGSGPKSAPPSTAKNPRASDGSASQAPPNAFPQKAYLSTSARDHVQSASQITGMPQHVEVSQMDMLSEQTFHFRHTELLNRKLQLRDMIYYTISPIFRMCGLYVVGSSLNGFGNANSDMDLGLMITNKDPDQRTDAVVVLSSNKRALQDVKFITRMQMILATVPILRMKFTSPFDDIVMDLNANNSVAIRNTHLFCYYSSSCF
ncbi:PAP/25A associated domain-containing protein [Aphelenchoides avenae]|nr:PAP/25A associated domain-containing protein [Aphelenchus avenae]